MTTEHDLRAHVLQLLRGGNAHLTFEDAVTGFPMDRINDRPPHVPYSPWHLLEHIRIAQWDILEFVRNPAHVSPEWPRGYWPDPAATADAARWQQTLRAFREDMAALEALAEDDSVDLGAPLPHAPGYTLLRELLLVADHNAYHLGEFAILRQVMGTWPADR